jgi:hypothetical protein
MAMQSSSRSGWLLQRSQGGRGSASTVKRSGRKSTRRMMWRDGHASRLDSRGMEIVVNLK